MKLAIVFNTFSVDNNFTESYLFDGVISYYINLPIVLFPESVPPVININIGGLRPSSRLNSEPSYSYFITSYILSVYNILILFSESGSYYLD